MTDGQGEDRRMAALKKIGGAAGAAGVAVIFGYAFEAVSRRIRRPLQQNALGRLARSPIEMPWRGWRSVLWRFTGRLQDARVLSLAGAVAFFTLLSLVPALSVFVALYGAVSDPLTIAAQLDAVTTVFPDAARELIREQAVRLGSQSVQSLSLTFALGFLVAIWSANAAMKALFDALNIIYGEREKRNFFKLNLVSLSMTVSGVVLLALALTLIASLPVVTALFPFEHELKSLIRLSRWPLFVCLGTIAIACLYWIGPSRRPPRFVWVLPGAAGAALLWAAASVLFSWYVSTLGNYTATYGSLATVVVFMTWLWISAVIVLAGAELNAELELQTSQDTTIGGARPLGARGAAVADTVASIRLRR